MKNYAYEYYDYSCKNIDLIKKIFITLNIIAKGGKCIFGLQCWLNFEATRIN